MNDDGWDEYWATHSGRGCIPDASPALERPIRKLWQDFARGLPRGATILDLAAGDGAVGRAITRSRRDVTVSGVDRAAVVAQPASGSIEGGVDCADLPFADASFAGVTSQFGIEYCPPAALAEAARVLMPGGALLFVAHDAASPLVAHNRERSVAARALIEAGIFDAARRAAARLPTDAAVDSAIARVRAAHVGQGIIGELIAALQQAVGRPAASSLIGIIEARLKAELARLDAMMTAALDVRGVSRIVEELRAGQVVARYRNLRAADGRSLAWIITGHKHG